MADYSKYSRLPLLDIVPDHYEDGVPVFTPTYAEFKDFYHFQRSINRFGMESGVVKVIPPHEWVESLGYTQELYESVRIRNPIVQQINMVQNGVFAQQNVERQRGYSLAQWKGLSEQANYQPPAERGGTRTGSTSEASVKGTNPNPATSNVAASRVITRRASTTSDSVAVSAGSSAKTRNHSTPSAPSASRTRSVSIASTEANSVTGTESAHSNHHHSSSADSKAPKKNPKAPQKAVKAPQKIAKPPKSSLRDFHIDISQYTPERCLSLEKTYWRTLNYAEPMYGADTLGSVFNPKVSSWNVSNLPNILDLMDEKLPGVNDAYLYAGLWKATFAWHLEDQDLYSINYIHLGAPKQWYAIPQSSRAHFFEIMKDLYPDEYRHCHDFLRHKTFLVAPKYLEAHGVVVNKVVHRQGEFMITYPYGYHCGFNYGYNLAESVNFALDYWFEVAEKTTKCECIDDSVGINVTQLKCLYNHEKYEMESDVVEISSEEESEVEIPKPKLKEPKVVKLKPKGEACLLCPNILPRRLLKLRVFELLEVEGKKGKVHRVCAYLCNEVMMKNVREDKDLKALGEACKAGAMTEVLTSSSLLGLGGIASTDAGRDADPAFVVKHPEISDACTNDPRLLSDDEGYETANEGERRLSVKVEDGETPPDEGVAKCLNGPAMDVTGPLTPTSIKHSPSEPHSTLAGVSVTHQPSETPAVPSLGKCEATGSTSAPVEIVTNFSAIPPARKNLRCLVCHLSGAAHGVCFQCDYSKCTRAYHATCAIGAGIFLDLETCTEMKASGGTDLLKSRLNYCKVHRPKLPEAKRLIGETFCQSLTRNSIVQFTLQGNHHSGLVVKNNASESTLDVLVYPKLTEGIEIVYESVLGNDKYFTGVPERPRKAEREKKEKVGKKIVKKEKVDPSAVDGTPPGDLICSGVKDPNFSLQILPWNGSTMVLEVFHLAHEKREPSDSSVWCYLPDQSTDQVARFTDNWASKTPNDPGYKRFLYKKGLGPKKVKKSELKRLAMEASGEAPKEKRPYKKRKMVGLETLLDPSEPLAEKPNATPSSKTPKPRTKKQKVESKVHYVVSPQVAAQFQYPPSFPGAYPGNPHGYVPIMPYQGFVPYPFLNQPSPGCPPNFAPPMVGVSGIPPGMAEMPPVLSPDVPPGMLPRYSDSHQMQIPIMAASSLIPRTAPIPIPSMVSSPVPRPGAALSGENPH